MNLSWPTAHPHVLACVVGLAASLASLVSVGRAAYAEDKPDKLPLELLAEASACYEVLDYACVTDLLALLPVWYQPSRVGAVPDGVALDQVPELLEAGRIPVHGSADQRLLEEEAAKFLPQAALGHR